MTPRHFTLSEKGFTLLLASLVVSLVLSVALAIANITLMQATLASAGRESQHAFYNADAGLECALYYEYNASNPDGTPFFSADGDDEPSGSIICDEYFAEDIQTTDNGATTTTTFSINPPGSDCDPGDETQPYFDIKVDKSVRDEFSNKVRIEARGYNTCDTDNPRRVERGMFVELID